MKKNQKILKPIDLDLHFKYRCTDINCGCDHWISLKESQTKNFKIVCDCGCIFKPKQISKIKILYVKKNKKQTILEKDNKETVKEKEKLSVETQEQCGKLLCSYGFTESESIDLIQKAFVKNSTQDAGLLVKYIIQNLEELNVSN